MILLASSATIEGIAKMIGKFYYSKNITLTEVSPGNFTVSNLNGKIESVCVVLKKGRYRFMRD